jgi:hypothetical protein
MSFGATGTGSPGWSGGTTSTDLDNQSHILNGLSLGYKQGNRKFILMKETRGEKLESHEIDI